jgi:hypothetical protein
MGWYFMRAMIKIGLNKMDGVCEDLSKAGELGYMQAYEEIKKYCK